MTVSQVAHFTDTSGRADGVATAAEIRGLGVIIPPGSHGKPSLASWSTEVSNGDTWALPANPVSCPKISVASQLFAIGTRRCSSSASPPMDPQREQACSSVTSSSRSTSHPIESPEDLLDLLTGDRVGRACPSACFAPEQKRS